MAVGPAGSGDGELPVQLQSEEVRVSSQPGPAERTRQACLLVTNLTYTFLILFFLISCTYARTGTYSSNALLRLRIQIIIIQIRSKFPRFSLLGSESGTELKNVAKQILNKFKTTGII